MIIILLSIYGDIDENRTNLSNVDDMTSLWRAVPAQCCDCRLTSSIRAGSVLFVNTALWACVSSIGHCL